MKIVNRAYLIVKPKAPFYAWASALGEDEFVVDEAYNEPNIYLIDEDVFEIEPVVQANFKRIFSNELEMLTDLESEWPEVRTQDVFEQWFDVELGSAVFDLDRSDLKTEQI